MTVRELIEALEKMDPGLEVVLTRGDGDFVQVDEASDGGLFHEGTLFAEDEAPPVGAYKVAVIWSD